MSDKTLTEQVNIVIATLQDDIKHNKLDLPSAPDLLIKLRRLTASPHATANQIADLVKHDINISGRLIKVANSALFGVRNHVTTVQAAITRLGQERVQSLVIGLMIGQKLLESKTLGLEHYCQQAWQASNNVAAISFVLASTKTDIDPEQALLAGMVHNIGTLPLLLKLNKIESLKTNSRILGLVAEAVIPKLYASAGRLILKSWNFPEEIIKIATEHRINNVTEANHPTISDIVFLAYQLDKTPITPTTETIPEAIATSAAFNKFWTNQQDAVVEIQELSKQIEQIKYDISN